MKSNKLNDKWARIIGIPLIAILIILLSGDDLNAQLSTRVVILKTIKNIFYVAFYWEFTRMIFIYMRNRLPDLKDTPKRLVAQVIVLLLFIIVAASLIALIQQCYPLGDKETFFSEYLDTLKKSLMLLGMVTICYECAYFFGKWENSLYESELLKKESLISQFELLKNQVSPHFLFNSLNALITLVPEDPALAVLFIQRLSSVYRHVLTYNEKNIIGLAEELDILKDYIFLNQMRFGDNLKIDYELLAADEQTKVVPFTLQMLVENAIKHNVISRRKPLTITISQKKDHIVVINNLQRRTSCVDSTQTGLQNIINRYQLLTNSLVEVIATPTTFSVSLPLFFENS
ncbi:MAG: histidine kinase [Bacteroidota bacterium]|nr:histidine kinase [Bacteroidota bacterium]